jgi:hypothetical protein
MPTTLPESIQLEARRLFHLGVQYFFKAKLEDVTYAAQAIVMFQCVLEWATTETWPSLWEETQQVIAEMRLLLS